MNIWALDKVVELKALLLLLQDQLVPESWVIASEDLGDHKSVRIRSTAEPSLTAYISLHGQPPGCFAVHLEYPTQVGGNRFDNTQIAEDLGKERALELLVMHFW